MKKDIHPKYHEKAKVKCACGNSFTIGSTKEARFEVWKKGHMKLNFPNDRFV